jgi:hypothetical protein
VNAFECMYTLGTVYHFYLPSSALVMIVTASRNGWWHGRMPLYGIAHAHCRTDSQCRICAYVGCQRARRDLLQLWLGSQCQVSRSRPKCTRQRCISACHEPHAADHGHRAWS